MAINSRSKGKRGELQLAELLRSFGHEARRGVQFKGGVDSPDVVCDTLPGFHFECKLVERGNLYDWMDQANRDANGAKIPVVAHRKSRRDWVAILNFEDFMLLVGANGDRGLCKHETMAAEAPGALEQHSEGVLRPEPKRRNRKMQGVRK